MIFKKLLTILILLPMVLLIPQPVQAECSSINFSSFVANPRSVNNANPSSEFTVRMTTTCPPADQDFIIFFATSVGLEPNPNQGHFDMQLSTDHFTRSANGQFYEGLYQATVRPFDRLAATTHTVTYYPRLWDISQNRVVATAPSSMRETITRSDAAGTPTPTPIQTPTPSGGGGTIDVPQIENPTKATDLSVLISRVIRILLSLIAMASAIMIIVSGFRMVAHGGNPATLESAKKGMIWAILGLVVAIMSFSIISIIQRLAS